MYTAPFGPATLPSCPKRRAICERKSKKQKQKAEAEAQQGRTWAREGGAFVQSNHNDPSWGFEVDLHQPSVLSQK
jgi:hypothetical protein